MASLDLSDSLTGRDRPAPGARAWWLDRVRGRLYSWLAKTAVGPLLVHRERRLALIASAGILGALALSVLAPAWLLLVGPLALGVPHLASDVRHLVLRRSLPRGFMLVVIVACLSLVTLRSLESLHAFAGFSGRVELGVASLWLIVAWWAGGDAKQEQTSSEPQRSGLALAALVILLSLAGQAWPYASRLFLAHAHNVIALLLWVQLFAAGASQGRGRRWVIVPTLLCGLSVLTLLWLPVQSLTLHYGVLQLWGFDVLETARWLAPFESVRWSLGLTLCYAALQSMHYTLWLYCIPQSDSRAQGSLTFRMTLRGWQNDFGGFALALLCVATLALLLAASIDADGARQLYLTVAGFHAYLELALWVFLLRRGVLPAQSISARQQANPC